MSDCSTESFKPHARMSKTKSQLRAEAVERLRKLNCMDVDCYQLLEATVDDAGEKVGYRVEIRKLIDLLTDDPMDAQRDGDGTCPDADGTPSIDQGDDGVAKLDAQARAEIEDAERSRAVSGDAAAEVDAGTDGTEKTPQEPRECGRITFTDTREKLEEDVRKWFADEYYDDYYSEEDMNSVVSKWLDRQAAITRAECQKDSENAADFEDSCDTREELEYDCKWMAYAWAPAEYPDDKLEKKLYREIIDKLDRQAAITTQECTDVYETGCEACRSAQKRKIAELQERVDNLCASEEIGNKLIMAQLETDAEKNRTIMEYAERVGELEAALKGERNNFEQATEARKHWQRKYENLKATSYSANAPSDESELARELGKALAERDMYREKLGRALDAAHEIVRMMEVE